MAAPTHPAREVELTAAAKRLLPWLVAVGFFMESLDTTILNTAVPVMAHSLKVPPLDMKAVLASYTLSLAVFIPISGWMANRFGTRRVFASAIAVFTLGSFLCGISTDIHVLVACRILQGCGGAMMLPVGRLTLVRAFAKSELIRALSFVAIPGLVGPMLGPLLGGLIVAYFHWSVIFFVNIPIGLCGLVLVRKHLPDFIAARNYPLDYVGLALFGSGISLLSYVLEVFGEHTLSGREIAGALAISAALLAAYGLHSVRTRHPLLQLSLTRIRSFRVAVSGNLFTRLGIGGLPFMLPLLYQVGLGYTPIQSGLMIMPQALAAISFKFTLPAILRKFGYRQVLIANTVMLGVMLMLFSLIDVSTPGWLIASIGVRIRILHLDAIHQHEHAGVCGCEQRAGERRQHHREHGAADGGELRNRLGLAGGGAVHSRSHPGHAAGDDPRHSPRAAHARSRGPSYRRSCSANSRRTTGTR